MASSSSAIEKLVFIAPLRPGLNHRCSHNFVVSSIGTAHPIPSPSRVRTSCLIFRCYGVVYYARTPVYFKYRYRKVHLLKSPSGNRGAGILPRYYVRWFAIADGYVSRIRHYNVSLTTNDALSRFLFLSTSLD
ncbi:unnamed protein product [Heterotrigona itama]|uniref:Uncharacterized protein n=1 Tax=Heterotrigona itama TaxID=395501 RepID=A0A6V7H945_9HYME|nr:unnamed protein product [Heterotrigona itama]